MAQNRATVRNMYNAAIAAPVFPPAICLTPKKTATQTVKKIKARTEN